MMKRVFAVLLVLSLAAACVPAAFGEAEALSRNELNAWRDQLLKDSIADNRYASESMEDGAYSLTFDWYTLIADTQRLSSATRIMSVFYEMVPDEDEVTPADIRGLRPGDTVEKLLPPGRTRTRAWPAPAKKRFCTRRADCPDRLPPACSSATAGGPNP